MCLIFFNSLPGFGKEDRNKELIIHELKLGYPCPAIPFYHFIAELELPQPSVIEVEAAINGKTLRFTDLHRADEITDMGRPVLSHRPPSGYGLSQDGTLYHHPHLVGWVKWEPGKDYEILIMVRMKENIHASGDDVFLTAKRKLKAPEDVPVFDAAWKNYKAIVLTETAGIDRKEEPVEVLLPFYPDEAQQLTRDIRVVSVDPQTHELSEVPSQVYDIQLFLEEDDLAPDKQGNPTREIPLWMPTVTARVAFLAEVPAKTSQVFLVYYNNEHALARMYRTDLRVQGEAPGLRVDNDLYSIVLHPNSGHLDQITLKNKPDVPLFHRMETNGAIHWNPGAYTPPRPWTHTADWKPPENVSFMAGPVISTAEMWDHLRELPEVDASVRYEFFPGLPYFISSTSMRINERIDVIALRNGEIVFKRELMTHAAWYDVIRDSVIVYDVTKMPDLTDLSMEADVPWITFFNEQTGIGFCGIQLDYSNAGLENRPRLLNPYMYITGGPWIYWTRALSFPFLSSNHQQVIPAMKGYFFAERWAYLTYEIDKGDKPYAPVLKWQKRLTNPLRVRLVEEVDERVSRSVHEVYMDEGKSGWEGRETSRH
ncbi:MAG: hypothetical protein AMS23_08180 [Bacteroides sp. SM1_62]|nr:MAG: hypothetical protein AMS26_14940 [Bacteroides sp. SM23_62]KPL22248.1 MAG: hypothetical protein AMS23_08180 [Bacteroides sp. SM1_62]